MCLNVSRYCILNEYNKIFYLETFTAAALFNISFYYFFFFSYIFYYTQCKSFCTCCLDFIFFIFFPQFYIVHYVNNLRYSYSISTQEINETFYNTFNGIYIHISSVCKKKKISVHKVGSIIDKRLPGEIFVNIYLAIMWILCRMQIASNHPLCSLHDFTMMLTCYTLIAMTFHVGSE